MPSPEPPLYLDLTEMFATGLARTLAAEGSGLSFILFLCEAPDPTEPEVFTLAYASSIEIRTALKILADFTATGQKKLEEEGAGHA